MTIGVGGKDPETVITQLTSDHHQVQAISVTERRQRIAKAQALLSEQRCDALYLDATTSLHYFTGLNISPSERLHGAAILPKGELIYFCPAFEREKMRDSWMIPGELACWEEHESPTELVLATLKKHGMPTPGRIALDERTPFFVFDGLRKSGPAHQFVNGSCVTAPCRMIKSAAELALLDHAMKLTLKAQAAVASALQEGMSTEQVSQIIARAQRKLGGDQPYTFCIVLFGEATAYPHGVPYSQQLRSGDLVLIDTGTSIEGYQSDLTRTYVFGDPTPRQKEVWEVEQEAQLAAFAAAAIGVPCEELDRAARQVIERAGFGPDYHLPGLPHRTGHGIGMDGHEWTYLVKGNRTPLATGMCFSIEPMICIYGEFGIRLEDHFAMTADGPRWFTQPSPSILDPFGLQSEAKSTNE